MSLAKRPFMGSAFLLHLSYVNVHVDVEIFLGEGSLTRGLAPGVIKPRLEQLGGVSPGFAKMFPFEVVLRKRQFEVEICLGGRLPTRGGPGGYLSSVRALSIHPAAMPDPKLACRLRHPSKMKPPMIIINGRLPSDILHT